MSAFLVTPTHVYTIARAYVQLVNHNDTPTELEVIQIAKILYKENLKSVNYRYNERNRLPNLKNVDFKPVSNVELIKLIHCLDYQSCETSTYKKSKAYQMINQLLLSLYEVMIVTNQEYNSAKWTI